MSVTGTITSPSAFQEVLVVRAPDHVVIAQYHRESDTTTFDWPAIEREAATEDSRCHGLAKILLAAREAGRDP